MKLGSYIREMKRGQQAFLHMKLVIKKKGSTIWKSRDGTPPKEKGPRSSPVAPDTARRRLLL